MKTDDAKKIISTAIDREVEAYTFYRTISDKVKDAALKKLFGELCRRREAAPGIFAGNALKRCHQDAL